MGKRELHESLEGHIVEASSIYCETNECLNLSETTSHEASREFYEEGWRVVNGRTFCPLCVKMKKLLKENRALKSKK